MATHTPKPAARPRVKAGASPAAATDAPDTTAAGTTRVRVRAKRLGFYGGFRIKPGVTFTLKAADDFADWMERVSPATPDALAQAQSDARSTPTLASRTDRVSRAGLETSVDAALPGAVEGASSSSSDEPAAADANVLGD